MADALGMIETKGFTAMVEAADAMVNPFVSIIPSASAMVFDLSVSL